MKEYEDKIIDVLGNSKIPLDIEKIRTRAGIGNWNTALKHCLELFLEGKISGQKSSKSCTFWAKQARSRQEFAGKVEVEAVPA